MADTEHGNYPPLVLKRIAKDYKNLKKEPVTNAAAEPKGDDLTHWNGIIRIPITDETGFLDLQNIQKCQFP